MKNIKFIINKMFIFSMLGVQVMLYSCSSAKPLTSSIWTPDLKQASDSIEGFCLIPESKLMVKVFNNREAMQIRLKITDKSTERLLLQNGLTVYLDTTARKKKNFTVIFPAAQPSMGGGPMGNAPKPGGGNSAAAGNSGSEPKPDKGGKPFDISSLVRDINQTGVVVKIGDIEYFADSKLMYASVDQFNSLNYIITIPYSKYASLKLHRPNLGIGILSEKEKKEMPSAGNSEGEGGDMAGGMGGGPGGGGGMGGGMGGPGGGMGGAGGGMGGGPGGGMGGGPGGGMGGHSGGMKPQSDSGSSSIKEWIVISLARL
jgi:hypothetical protein